MKSKETIIRKKIICEYFKKDGKPFDAALKEKPFKTQRWITYKVF